MVLLEFGGKVTRYIAVPKLGMAKVDVTIVEWKVNEGDWVEKNQLVAIIETEKITYEVEAEVSGFLHILVKEENRVQVGRVIALLAKSKEELDALQKDPEKEIFVSDMENFKKGSVPIETSVATQVFTGVSKRKVGRVRISQVARKMAGEHGIDISKINGSGPGGRITKDDIKKALAVQTENIPQVELNNSKRVKTTIPLKSMRKVIAEHMLRSLSVSAQVTIMGELDTTELVELRGTLLEQEEGIGARISYTDIFIYGVAKVLKDHPMVNSSIIDNEIKVWDNINIGFAIALEDGLIVPIVKDADRKSLVEISYAVRNLAEKARKGKLMPNDVTGGTFTITNLGALGGGYRFETVIINQPESAILGTGGITDRAVVREGQVVIRPIMTYYLTYDHRVFNGAEASKFVMKIAHLLENPGLLML